MTVHLVPGGQLQGSRQFFSRQAKLLGQSSSTRHSGWRQAWYGSPSNRSGQKHWGRWTVTRQRAFVPQVSNTQGLLHWRLMQASFDGQSVSAWHPTMNTIMKLASNVNNWMLLRNCDKLPWKHWTWGFPVNPSAQTQTGRCWTTRHWALGAQMAGRSRQGLIQRCSIQAWVVWQSGSTSHSGLVTTGSMTAGRGWQRMNGSPWYPLGQEQTGLCPMTWQRASIPQVPGQGSRHLWLTQAKLLPQSELVVHSGLQAT